MTTATLTPRLFNPTTFDAAEFDPATQRLFRATIDWFEAKGQAQIAEEVRKDEWYGDFIEFVASERAFAILLTPERDGGGDPDKRWDTARNAASTRSWASTDCPTGTRGRSRSSGSGRSGRRDNDGRAAARRRAPRGRRDLRLRPLRARPRRRHLLDRHGPRRPTATAASAQAAASTTSATATWRGWSRSSADAPTSRARTATCSSPPTARTPPTTCVKNVVNAQMYVSEFDLDDYPVRPEDVLHTGNDAFDAALNTVNVGKFNLGFARSASASTLLRERHARRRPRSSTASA